MIGVLCKKMAVVVVEEMVEVVGGGERFCYQFLKPIEDAVSMVVCVPD